jgi:hypothetical protein
MPDVVKSDQYAGKDNVSIAKLYSDPAGDVPLDIQGGQSTATSGREWEWQTVDSSDLIPCGHISSGCKAHSTEPRQHFS